MQHNSGQHNGSGAFTVSLAAPAAPTSRVVVTIAGNTVVATPTGWTLRTSQVNWMGHYLMDRPGGASSWTFTANGQLVWWVAELRDGTYIDAASANSTADATTYATPSLTPPAGHHTFVASIGTVSTTATKTARTVTAWTGGFTEVADGCVAASDYPMQGVAVLDDSTGGAARATTATFSGISGGRTAALAVYATSPEAGPPPVAPVGQLITGPGTSVPLAPPVIV